MKNFLLICFLQCWIFGFSQRLKPVAQKVSEYHNGETELKSYDLFEINKNLYKSAEYKRAATDVTVMSLKHEELKRLIKEKPEFLEISFPFDGDKQITLEMYRHQILTNDFKVGTDNGMKVEYTPGVYYQGIVKGDNTSIVAFSFFNNDIVGVASTPELGNIVLGKAKENEDFVSYSDSKLTSSSPFICAAEKLKENQTPKPVFNLNNTHNKKTDNCVRIYYEAGFQSYTINGSSITATTNWLTAMHNNVATLYANENVNVALSEIFIWTTTDPYIGSSDEILDKFRTTRMTFNGDVAQLLKTSSTVTSTAYVNSLCNDYRYSYCSINFTYQSLPTYSWNIEAMAHELGHNFGSLHTHACVWNGNNTAIDGCGPAAGKNEGCTAALPSAGGGTIMSYCHLVGSVGINFANGFGMQPGTLIRNKIDSKGCLGTNCTGCPTSTTNFSINNITQTSAIITFTDTVSTAWKYNLTTGSGVVVSSGNVSNPSLNLNNLQPASYYKLSVETDCSGFNEFHLSKLFLTDGAWCDGTQFLDTGGSTGQYRDNEDLVKTFYPTPGSSMTMTFTAFDLEQGRDFMYVYNGPSTTSPLFANGNSLSGNTVPGPFTSTDPSGAITVRFVSDGVVTENGWNAKFSCNVLAVEDINIKNNLIDIYPNPAKNIIILSSKERLKGYKIYDEAGRLVASDSSLKGNKQEISLSSIQTGNYVITVETEMQTVSKKLIKQ